jgi:muramoyltetrapeptide carboxypeptidase
LRAKLGVPEVISAPVKPHALKRGDVVGVLAPAAAVEREYLERGVSVLAAMGFRVRVSARALDRDGILAGTDRDRADELQAFFADPEVRAVFAARGGYGCGRLLPLLDFDAIARTPKPFIGFSDATFLLNVLVERARMVAFHGPMVAMDFARGLSPRSFEHMRKLLAGELSGFEMRAREAVHPGTAEGELMGGCLSVVAAMLGTPWAPTFEGKILFLEDTGEKAYRVDRMLVQLRQAGALDRCAGIVMGAIRPVNGDEREARLITRFVAEQTRQLRCPVLFGIEAGHGTENLTLPLGVRASIDSQARRLVVMEAAVS